MKLDVLLDETISLLNEPPLWLFCVAVVMLVLAAVEFLFKGSRIA